ncbi:tetratricopeptide repeat protein [Lactobacillaceae bacterium 24-114]
MTYAEKMLDQLNEGHLDEALQSFNDSLANDSDEIIYNLAEELYSLGFLQQARQAYLQLLRKYPDDDEIRVNLAEIAINEGHNDEALTYLSQIKPSSDAYLQSLLVSADLYQTEGEYEVTESKLKEAYQLAPDEPAVEFALGEFYFMIGKFNDAIQYYFQLIKNGYTEFAKVDIAGRLGTCYAQSGQFKQALGYLKQVKPEYQSSNIRFETGLTELQLDDTKAAIKTLQELIEDDSQYAPAYIQLATAYAKENKYQQALQTLQEGMAVDQYNPQLYAQAAEVTSHLGNNKLMDEYLTKAHELDPDNLTITLQYSNFLLHIHKDKENIKLLEPLVDEDEVDPQVYWNLARSYQRLDDLEEAGKNYEAALPTYSENPTFLKDLISYYREVGETDQLVDELKHYLTLNPSDDEMQELLQQYEEDY